LRHEFEQMYRTAECYNSNTMLESNYLFISFIIIREKRTLALMIGFKKNQSLYSIHSEI
jgi:hypothetical protein